MTKTWIAVLVAMGLLVGMPMMLGSAFTSSGEPTESYNGVFKTTTWVIANETTEHNGTDADWGEEVEVNVLLTDNAVLTLRNQTLYLNYTYFTNSSIVLFENCIIEMGNMTVVNDTTVDFFNCSITFPDLGTFQMAGNDTDNYGFCTVTFENSTINNFNLTAGDGSIPTIEIMDGFGQYGRIDYNGTNMTVEGNLILYNTTMYGRDGWNNSYDNKTAFPYNLEMINSTWEEPTGFLVMFGPIGEYDGPTGDYASVILTDSHMLNVSIMSGNCEITGTEFSNLYILESIDTYGLYGGYYMSVLDFCGNNTYEDNYFHDAWLGVQVLVLNFTQSYEFNDCVFEDINLGIMFTSDYDMDTDISVSVDGCKFDTISMAEETMISGLAITAMLNQSNWDGFVVERSDFRDVMGVLYMVNGNNNSNPDNDNITVVESTPVFHYNNFYECHSVLGFLANFTEDVVLDMTENWWSNVTMSNATYVIDLNVANFSEIVELYAAAVYIHDNFSKLDDYWNLTVDNLPYYEYPVEDMTFELVEGWNMISVPFDTSLVNLTALLNETFIDAIAFRVGETNNYTLFLADFHNNFTVIEEEGWSVIYIWANEDSDLTFTNTDESQIISYTLSEGWNLVPIVEYGGRDILGFWNFDNETLPAVAMRDSDGNYTILLFNTTLIGENDTEAMNDLTYGDALYVYAEGDVEVEIQAYQFSDLFSPVIYQE